MFDTSRGILGTPWCILQLTGEQEPSATGYAESVCYTAAALHLCRLESMLQSFCSSMYNISCPGPEINTAYGPQSILWPCFWVQVELHPMFLGSSGMTSYVNVFNAGAVQGEALC